MLLSSPEHDVLTGLKQDQVGAKAPASNSTDILTLLLGVILPSFRSSLDHSLETSLCVSSFWIDVTPFPTGFGSAALKLFNIVLLVLGILLSRALSSAGAVLFLTIGLGLFRVGVTLITLGFLTVGAGFGDVIV